MVTLFLQNNCSKCVNRFGTNSQKTEKACYSETISESSFAVLVVVVFTTKEKIHISKA